MNKYGLIIGLFAASPERRLPFTLGPDQAWKWFVTLGSDPNVTNSATARINGEWTTR